VDSNKASDENAELPGNRTMTNDYFLKWWSNGLPIFNHVYITVGETVWIAYQRTSSVPF